LIVDPLEAIDAGSQVDIPISAREVSEERGASNVAFTAVGAIA
jgi:hypothetical protein